MLPTDRAPSERPFTVLAVCTGNICRSPAVERLLAAEIGADTPSTAGDSTPVLVASAGVGAVVGAAMPEPMAALVRGAGASADGFAARQLTEAMLREADLVLALTRRHRSAIVSMYPGVVRRTFTLRELARLAQGVDPDDLPVGSVADRVRALAPLAAAQRSRHTGPATEDDVVDPYGGDDVLYERSFSELRPAVAAIAAVIRGDGRRRDGAGRLPS